MFKKLWKDIAANLDNYKGYPRIVGETGQFVYSTEMHQGGFPLTVIICLRSSQVGRISMSFTHPRRSRTLYCRLFAVHLNIRVCHLSHFMNDDLNRV